MPGPAAAGTLAAAMPPYHLRHLPEGLGLLRPLSPLEHLLLLLLLLLVLLRHGAAAGELKGKAGADQREYQSGQQPNDAAGSAWR